MSKPLVIAAGLIGLCAAPAFAATPVDAPAKLTPACRAAHDYTTLGPAKSDVFADQVDYIGPDGKAKSSKADILAGYAAAGAKMQQSARASTFRITHLLPIGERECLLEFEQTDASTGEYFLVAIDHFKVNDQGKVIFFRPFVQTAAIMRNPVFRDGLMGTKP